jgi:hypothetical protein
MNRLVLKDHLFLNNGTTSDLCIQNNSPPIITVDWDYSQSITIDDVKIWEELYTDPYNIGIYSSWNPYVEFYLLVYYDFVDSRRFKTFYGLNSHDELKRYLDQCEIVLPINSINL